ncbi:four-carbon acid sugar kinase family protein [Microbacterium sp. ET2]|uniref:3-oxo-tetronate kinase n=1 Tax=Microbacterium albipurpureum TaxID=3050384 RepID=UPI00259CB938|nr:3-oxo-tetronate kinase [Microbacterium sp. ET2 (Ac-2212)]WJL94947.1 four-carbon acid sugar kinase family protein [Microbacterium sp. ET2 (Ac-2212)]
MIGVIADDFTGATDVAVAFRSEGARTAIVFGDPSPDVSLPSADVVVVALKTRTIPPDVAVEQSLRTARLLLADGATQLYFKICSTFDSTSRGNIGPVADALVELHGGNLTTVVAPSSPRHGRRQLFGHLFVGAELLSDSPMRHHPLTPMTDPRVPFLLQQQTRHRVGLIDLPTVMSGSEAVVRALAGARARGERYVVVDAVSVNDLDVIGEAVRNAPLMIGAAGLAAGVARALWRNTPPSLDEADTSATAASTATTRGVAIAGSCAARTLEQIEHMKRSTPSYRIDALTSGDPSELARRALAWFDSLSGTTSALIYTSLPSQQLRTVQNALGTERASMLLEGALSSVAIGLADRGVRRLVIAGGETSGAVVEALRIRSALIGSEAAAGVPWVHSLDERRIQLLLKSGNFGGIDLLTTATACA